MNMENRKEITGWDVTGLPEATGVRLLYDNDSWAGPLEGMCEWNGERFYFLCSSGTDGPFPRKYALIRLTEGQAQIEAEVHTLYVERVGDFAEYEHGERKGGPVKDDASVARFWEEYALFPTFCIGRSQLAGRFEV